MDVDVDLFLLLKWLHVLSATLLFGTGLGTAFHMWMAHRSGEPRTIAVVAGNVILADWLFTVPSGIAQPASGIALVLYGGFPPFNTWLAASYGLFSLALCCWLPVMGLQYRIARLAQAAADAGGALPRAYHRAMRAWFWLGWPAFLALIGVFGLMVLKPT
jgi:uncharacterized membrane protein